MQRDNIKSGIQSGIQSDTKIEEEINNIIEATSQYINNPDMNLEQDQVQDTQDTQDTQDKQDTQDTQVPIMNEASIEVFNTALHQYLRINEEIKTLMQAIKTRNEIKKNLSDTLSNYLKTNQIKNVNLDGSYKGKRLENIINHTTTGFNRANVTEAIYNELQEDQEIFAKIMEALSKTTVMKEVCKLKIIEDKKPRRITGIRKTKEHNAFGETSELLSNE